MSKNINDIQLFKKATSIRTNKKLYNKINKKTIKKYKKMCNDKSKNIGNWCTNQHIRYLLENKGVSDILSAEKIYKLREKHLANNIFKINNIFFSKVKNLKPTSIKILPTGSTNMWSDKDVQILLNLYDNFTLNNLKTLTKIITDTRKKNQEYFFVKHNRLYDTYYDINFYMPGLFNFICLPKSDAKTIDKYRQYAYTSDTIIKKNHLEIQLVFKPDFSQYPEEFLYTDILRSMKKYNMKLDRCYDIYIDKPATAIISIINNIHSNTPFLINKYLSDIVSINSVCAEMYFSICTTIYVVWYMQINKSETKCEQLLKDLHYLAIPTVVENHIHFTETKKKKYLERKKHALKHANKHLLITLLKNAIKISGQKYSQERIIAVKNLLKELCK